MRIGVLSAWLHYQLGTLLGQILDVFNFHLRMKLTGGGLVHIWNRIGEIVRPWYDEIQETALASAVLNVDETGWRVNGEPHWLWCFTTSAATYYLIDRSRGSPALKRFFRQEFASKRAKLDVRLSKLIDEPWRDRECRRLVKRLRRHAGELFTFLDYEGVPADNNHAERQIRPAVQMRKTSYANGSDEGAETLAILMSVFRTPKLRGINPTDAIVKALRQYLDTSELKPMSSIATPGG